MGDNRANVRDLQAWLNRADYLGQDLAMDEEESDSASDFEYSSGSEIEPEDDAPVPDNHVEMPPSPQQDFQVPEEEHQDPANYEAAPVLELVEPQGPLPAPPSSPQPQPPQIAQPQHQQVIHVDQQVQVQATDEDVSRIVECPVCYNVLLPPITLCYGGHSICASCREHQPNCPICRRHFTPIRNRIVEDLLELCQIQCRYSIFGCNVVLHGSALAVHQQQCGFRNGENNRNRDFGANDHGDDDAQEEVDH